MHSCVYIHIFIYKAIEIKNIQLQAIDIKWPGWGSPLYHVRGGLRLPEGRGVPKAGGTEKSEHAQEQQTPPRKAPRSPQHKSCHVQAQQDDRSTGADSGVCMGLRDTGNAVCKHGEPEQNVNFRRTCMWA